MTSTRCPTDLCAHCWKFIKDLCASTTSVDDYPDWTIPKPSRCDLCRYIWQNMRERGPPPIDMAEDSVDVKVILKESRMQSEEQLLCLCIMVTPVSYEHIYLAFWADPSTQRLSTSS